jgi:DNA invertase Pin-like site-specific DNA recombinase
MAGDSLNRQLRLSQEYADGKGLILDDSLSLKDLGLSAYSGEHRTKGALGKFIELVNSGQVPKGSILIVESLDRLSREQVLDAFNQFLQIINNKITIVTLTDGMEYSVDTINANVMQLMISLIIMSRAHEESLIKSKRLSSSWRTKRANIHNRKLTARAPAWLKLDRRNNKFTAIPERAKMVQLIFKKYLDGIGPQQMEKQLNAMEQAWKLKSGWRKSYIMKILRNKAVIGEFQPYTKKGGKRIPAGEPIKNYFPKVVTENTFYRVQEKLASNTTKGGRNGKIHNLFSYIAKCGYCGAPMQFINKGKGWVYLVCDNKRRGRGCIDTSYRYDEFEKTFLEFCTGLSLDAILPNTNRQHDLIKVTRGESEAIEGKLKTISARIENLDYQVSIAKSKDAINHATQNLEKALEESSALQTEHKRVNATLKRLLKKESTVGVQLQNVQQLLQHMGNKEGDELLAIRLKLRAEIRNLVDKIDVFPHGLVNKALTLDGNSAEYINYDDALSHFKTIGYDPDHFPSEEAFQVTYEAAKGRVKEYRANNTGKQHRRFAITFKAGGFKEVVQDNGKYIVGITGEDPASLIRDILHRQS